MKIVQMIVHSPVKPITTITLYYVLFGCCILTGSTPPIVTNSINLHRQKETLTVKQEHITDNP